MVTAGRTSMFNFSLIRAIFTFLIIVLLTGSFYAQEVLGWKVLTSMRSIKGVAVDTDGVWAGTEGGAFFYKFADSTYETFTKNEKLSGSPITAVFKDEYGKVWFGCLNGQIDVIERKTDGAIKVKSILHIKNANFNNKQIKSFSASGDTIFASIDFGVCLINARDLSIIDTYSNFSSEVTNTSVAHCVKHGKIFAIIGDGVAVNKPGAVNLSVPESWDYMKAVQGYPLTRAVKLGVYKENVIAATANGIVKYTGTNWELLNQQLNFLVKDFAVSGENLYVLAKDSLLYKITNNVVSLVMDLKLYKPIGITEASGTFYLSSSLGVVCLPAAGNAIHIFPDGPQDNQLYSISTDVDGNLWVATGRDGAGKGIFRFDGKKWKTFDVARYPMLWFNDYVNVYGHPNGDVYAGSWGRGVVQIRGDSVLNRYDTTNTPMRGITGSTGHLVIGGVCADSKQNVWYLDLWPGDQYPLHVQTTNGTWYSYAYLLNPSIYDFYNLVIDNYDTKWFTSINDSWKGLYYYNEMKTFSNINDDVFNFASKVSTLSGKKVNSIRIDRRGDLWVGTDLGAFVCSQPQDVLSNDQLPSFASIFSLRQYAINDIAVDGINRKWIATSQGLILVSSDGQTVLANYNTTNSPLISDNIKKLAMDIKNGILYVGMDGAIVAATTLALEPNGDLSSLIAYPNPVKLTENSTITFEGLIKDSEINIMTSSCKLVKHIITPGGAKASWDGRDEDGNLVASGVYFAVVYDKEGSTLKSTKLAVIRK